MKEFKPLYALAWSERIADTNSDNNKSAIHLRIHIHIRYSKAVQGNSIVPILSRNLLFTFCSIIDLVQSRQIYVAVSVYIYVHMYDITLLEVETFSSAYSCMWQRRKRKKNNMWNLCHANEQLGSPLHDDMFHNASTIHLIEEECCFNMHTNEQHWFEGMRWEKNISVL